MGVAELNATLKVARAGKGWPARCAIPMWHSPWHERSGALTGLGFGIVGQYLWLGLQMGRRRPNYIIQSAEDHGAKDL